MVSNGFPNVTTSGQQYYSIGEKPSVILYSYTSPCRDTKTTILFICLGVPDYSSNMVLHGLREV